MFIQLLKSEVFVFLNQQLIHLKVPPQHLFVPNGFSNPNSCQKSKGSGTISWRFLIPSYSLKSRCFPFFRPMTFTKKPKQQPRHGCTPHRWCPRVASPRTWHAQPHRWRPDLFFSECTKKHVTGTRQVGTLLTVFRGTGHDEKEA